MAAQLEVRLHPVDQIAGSLRLFNPFAEHALAKAFTAGADQKENWAGSKSIVLYESEGQLLNFVEDALAGRNLGKKMYFGYVSDGLAQRILSDTSLDVNGFNCSLAAQEIRKISKDHGNEKSENMRGQRGIRTTDFAYIPRVIQGPEKIRLSPTSYHGKPVINFVKTINGSKTTVTAVVSDNHMNLFVQTMYAGAYKRSLATVADEHASANSPKRQAVQRLLSPFYPKAKGKSILST